MVKRKKDINYIYIPHQLYSANVGDMIDDEEKLKKRKQQKDI